MVNKEVTMHLIAYNLVRALMLDAATAHAVHLERISLKGTIDTVRHWAPALAQSGTQRCCQLYQLMLHTSRQGGTTCPTGLTVPNLAPKKTKAKNYPLLTQPRKPFKEIPHRNRYRKPKSCCHSGLTPSFAERSEKRCQSLAQFSISISGSKCGIDKAIPTPISIPISTMSNRY